MEKNRARIRGREVKGMKERLSVEIKIKCKTEILIQLSKMQRRTDQSRDS